MLRGLIFFTVFISVTACTKSEKTTSADGGVSANLTIQANASGCLDLETISRQMDNQAFQFPGFVYTRNFEILSPSSSANFTSTLIARSFRADSTRIHGLADLRGVKQNGCESISMPDAAGIPLTYNITSHTPTELELELNFEHESAKPAFEALSVEHREVIKSFPAVKKWHVKALGPTRVELISNYKSIPNECPKVSSLEIREHLVYNWSGDGSALDQVVKVEPGYFKRLEELSGYMEFGETNAEDGLVHLTPAASGALIQALQVRPYAPCN